MKDKVKCTLKDCPYCKAGIPRRTIVPIYDFVEKKMYFFDMRSETYKRFIKNRKDQT